MGRNKLIQVRYRNDQVGSVDDITLNELILSHKIEQFYRPSQEKWINIEIDPVRIRKSIYGGHNRRESDEDEEDGVSEEKSHGLLSRMLRHKRKTFVSKKALTAEDWFERGFRALQVNDGNGAVRAFAKAIDLDPTYQSAYLNRGITYEIVGNLQHGKGG